MKILYYVGYPLAWAKGGHAIMVHETIREVEKLGIETAWLHHEDREPASADIIHYFARPPSDFHWQLAKQRGMKIVVDELHQVGVLRPRWMWHVRGQIAKAFPHIVGRGIYSTMGIDVYRHLDAAIAVTPSEADYLRIVMGSPAERIHFIPSGVDNLFFERSRAPVPFDGLLYVANICARKNSIAVARQAKQSRVPVKFVSTPNVPDDDYTREFAREVDDTYVIWDKNVTDRSLLAAMYRGARGSFLASKNEGLPLSLLESLASGTPIMSPDLPNLRVYFKDAVRYAPSPDHRDFAAALVGFYHECRNGYQQDFAVLKWSDVAQQLAQVYLSISKRRD